ncbi:hypothetical protein KKF91_19040 [Myxococcota bacterium]|nr:hypothetical protein [Myxococcota bacterium]MBU1432641.1 hypothetical protein [Myxococcota bacterium]MBU1897431.1 hypothetical protein [Myxococcota bacterium]
MALAKPSGGGFEAALLDAARRAGLRVIWLTCPGREEGLDALARRLRLRCAHQAARRDVFLDASALAVTHPMSLLGRVVFIVGPSIRAAALPDRWREAIQGAALLAQRRRTTEEALAVAIHHLLRDQITPLGVVWNPRPPRPWPWRPRHDAPPQAKRPPMTPATPARAVISPKLEIIDPATLTSPPIPASALGVAKAPTPLLRAVSGVRRPYAMDDLYNVTDGNDEIMDDSDEIQWESVAWDKEGEGGGQGS